MATSKYYTEHFLNLYITANYQSTGDCLSCTLVIPLHCFDWQDSADLARVVYWVPNRPKCLGPPLRDKIVLVICLQMDTLSTGRMRGGEGREGQREGECVCCEYQHYPGDF